MSPPVDCGACHGSGWVVRDADIGTEQECFSCGGSGEDEDAAREDLDSGFLRKEVQRETEDEQHKAEYDELTEEVYQERLAEWMADGWQASEFDADHAAIHREVTRRMAAAREAAKD